MGCFAAFIQSAVNRYYENHRTVERARIFASLPHPLSWMNSNRPFSLPTADSIITKESLFGRRANCLKLWYKEMFLFR